MNFDERPGGVEEACARGAEAWVLVYAVLFLVSIPASVKWAGSSEPLAFLRDFLPHSRCSVISFRFTQRLLSRGDGHFSLKRQGTDLIKVSLLVRKSHTSNPHFLTMSCCSEISNNSSHPFTQRILCVIYQAKHFTCKILIFI